MSTVYREHESTAAPEVHVSKRYVAMFFIFGAIIAGAVIFLYGCYFGHWYHGLARILARTIPLPAVIVDDQIVWYEDVSEIASLIEVSSRGSNVISQAFDESVDENIERANLYALAGALGVDVAEDDIEEYSENHAELTSLLSDVGWDDDDYKKYVVLPLLVSQAAEKAVHNSYEYQEEALARIEKIRGDIELGLPFEDLALQYSDDISAKQYGDIGYIGSENVEPGLEPIFGLNIGDISGILETEEYFALAEVYGLVGSGDSKKVAVRMIIINKVGLDSAIEKFSENRKIVYLIR